MIIETQGIVLKLVPYSNTSFIVTFITPRGLLTGMAKGARKLDKTAWRGLLELGRLYDLVLFRKKDREIDILSECAEIEGFPNITRNWSRMSCMLWGVEIIRQFSHPDLFDKKLYNLFLWFLYKINGQNFNLKNLLIFFQSRLLVTEGFFPELTTCILCHEKIQKGESAVWIYDEVYHRKCCPMQKDIQSITGTQLLLLEKIANIPYNSLEKSLKLDLSSALQAKLQRLLNSLIGSITGKIPKMSKIFKELEE